MGLRRTGRRAGPPGARPGGGWTRTAPAVGAAARTRPESSALGHGGRGIVLTTRCPTQRRPHLNLAGLHVAGELARAERLQPVEPSVFCEYNIGHDASAPELVRLGGDQRLEDLAGTVQRVGHLVRA